MKESISSIADDINTLTNRIHSITGFTDRSELDLQNSAIFYVFRRNMIINEVALA